MTKILQGSKPIHYLTNANQGILFLHGFTSTPYELKDYAEHFHKIGFSVRVPLLAGHGLTVDALNNTIWQQWYADAKTSLLELRKYCDKIAIIGQSMGGTLALHLAAHYQVEGLVLLAPGLILKNKAAFLIPFLQPFLNSIKKNYPDIKDLSARKQAITYDRTPLKATNELMSLFKHVKDDLQDVFCPTLIVHSTHDHVIDYKSSEIVYKKISSSEKRFLSLNDSYHVLSLDKEKNLVLNEIEKFLLKTLGTPRL